MRKSNNLATQKRKIFKLEKILFIMFRKRLKKDVGIVGRWSFLVGIIVSILAVFFSSPSSAFTFAFLTVLGLIVGFFNVPQENDMPFLVAVIALVVFSIAGIEVTSVFGDTIGGYLRAIFRNYVVFFAAAGFVIAKKVIFSSTKTPKMYFGK
jgi:hypothetical protein